ncbi:hypothetical protein BCV70DRAFT_225733 [Testicularia cyperi]|uniref:RNA polymerase II subunit A C-terminal domain phosphatase n=1 Tax=Testicularia cyperi TaxID=1882483 RepID=A0A317XU31_9BASI|nr:hypothetical protein BCV70DRAFT_225733 [Testicularia cyperi]
MLLLSSCSAAKGMARHASLAAPPPRRRPRRRQQCTHPVQFGGMCAVCAKQLDPDSSESAAMPVMHSNAGVKVSAQEAHRLDSEHNSHLLSQRKLALIVDLDQTIIHATVDPTVGEWMRDQSNPNYHALQSVGKFRLDVHGHEVVDGDQHRDFDSCWYYVKPRPGVPHILRHLSHIYEMHVYTMGTRSYADCICKLVDPDRSIFGNRILSRNESGSLTRKTLSRLFPVDHSMVVIIDDREDVWRRSPNLVPVVPYEFFVGIGDINATHLPAQPTTIAGPPLPDSTSPISQTDTSHLAAATPAALPSPLASLGSLDPSSTSSSSSGTAASTPGTSGTDATPQEAMTKEELRAAREAAALLAVQTESLQTKLVQQRETRPLAKMQEALNEKLGKQNGTASSSPSGTSTPNPNADANANANPMGNEHPNGTSTIPQSSSADPSSSTTTTPPPSPPPQPQPQPQPPQPPGGEASSSDPSSSSSSDSPPSSSTLPQPPPSPPPPPPPLSNSSQAVLVDDDNEMVRIQRVLEDLHTEWYAAYDHMQAHPKPQEASDPTIQKPSVIQFINAKKAEVLKGCTIVFSSMIPMGVAPETSIQWELAREFGATPADRIEPGVTTHVVAARPGTAKVNQAHRLNSQGKLHLVWPSWFHVSTSRWERQSEPLYRITPESGADFPQGLDEDTDGGADDGEAEGETEHRNTGTAADTTLESVSDGVVARDTLASSSSQGSGRDSMESARQQQQQQQQQKQSEGGTTTEEGEGEGEGEGAALFESELNDMDWGAAADEVDAYLDSATTASNTSSPSPSMLAHDEGHPVDDDKNNNDDDRQTAAKDSRSLHGALTGLRDSLSSSSASSASASASRGGRTKRPRSADPDSSKDNRSGNANDADSLSDRHGGAGGNSGDRGGEDQDPNRDRDRDRDRDTLSTYKRRRDDTTETNSVVDDDYLDDLAEELDGQLDNE